MLNLVKSDHYDVIFPVTDATVIPIVKHKQEFSKHTIVPFADYQTLTKASDKAQTLKIAIKNDIPCPKTYFVNGQGDLEKVMEEIDYPVVIKPRTSFGARGVVLCESANDLRLKYKRVYAEYGASLVQEYIPPGDEIGVYVLFNFDSEPCAVTVQRRIRSYPVSGGPSTLRETIMDKKLVEIAFELLKILKWQGVAMVEFRVDPRDGVPKLMEINPRFWGSLQLSILSGVDFPYLLYKLVTEGYVEPNLDYKTGVKCRWLLPGDMLWFFSAPNKLRNVKEFIKFNTNYDILSWDDPFYLRAMPFWLLKFLLKKVNKTRAGMIYIHLWEVYSKTPRLKLPLSSRFITYYGIGSALNKVKGLLKNFDFAPVREVLEL